MKNNVLWIIITILALIVGLCIGYIAGNDAKLNTRDSSILNSNENIQGTDNHTLSAVGSYKNDSWNGKSAALVLKADGTCLYPTGDSGTWTQNGSIIKIILDRNDSVHTAELVPDGLILHEHFFEAVS